MAAGTITVAARAAIPRHGIADEADYRHHCTAGEDLPEDGSSGSSNAGFRPLGHGESSGTETGAAPQLEKESHAGLPDGYQPLREVRDMGLLGRWTPLDDAMSPCDPSRIVAAMQRRQSLGDHDARAWLDLHARAIAGDVAAQRTMGAVFENGRHRTTADAQRAFFWYYRAGLQGDVQAHRNAQRLMQVTHISAAALAEPALVYAGQWRITTRLSATLCSISVFDLAEDGSATGSLVRYGDPESGRGIRPPALKPAETVLPDCSPFQGAGRYTGGWAFDGYGNVLTIVFETDGASARHWRSDHWQIAISGCRPGSLYGRDRGMVGYTLEPLDTEPPHMHPNS